jgi:hypothetical protein
MNNRSTSLLTSAEIEKALTELGEYQNSARLVLADYRNEKRLFSNGIISQDELQSYEQMLSKRIAVMANGPGDLPDMENSEKASVFLSYNHSDMQVALRIKEFLAKHQVRVRMDVTDVKTGMPIRDFILEQTKGNNAVMLLLSQNSLTSAWVSYEYTLASFDQLLNNKRIIPVSIDNSYLDNSFSFTAFQAFDDKIARIESDIRKAQDNKWDCRYLQSDLDRLIDARGQLGPILQKLRQIAVRSVAAQEMEATLRHIARDLVRSA